MLNNKMKMTKKIQTSILLNEALLIGEIILLTTR